MSTLNVYQQHAIQAILSAGYRLDEEWRHPRHASRRRLFTYDGREEALVGSRYVQFIRDEKLDTLRRIRTGDLGSVANEAKRRAAQRGSSPVQRAIEAIEGAGYEFYHRVPPWTAPGTLFRLNGTDEIAIVWPLKTKLYKDDGMTRQNALTIETSDTETIEHEARKRAGRVVA